jgi:hypothetical protein
MPPSVTTDTADGSRRGLSSVFTLTLAVLMQSRVDIDAEPAKTFQKRLSQPHIFFK